MNATLADAVEVVTDEPCSESINNEEFVEARFWMVVVVFGSIAVLSVLENSFLFLLFLTSRQHRNSYSLYLLLLAFFDVFMGVSYLMVMSMKLLLIYTRSYILKKIWAMYVVDMMTVSHIAMTASSYLITFAAVERYCITVSSGMVDFLQKNRKFFVAFAVLFGIVSKGTIKLEIDVRHNEDCAGTLDEWRVFPSKLTLTHLYNLIWRFYFRTISTILLPFFVLSLLSVLVILRLRESARYTSAITTELAEKNNVKMKKARILAATRTLVILVATYLLSNLLSVIVTIWEYVSYKTLISERFVQFYILSVDILSALTIVACALRLPIYASCQSLLRAEMLHFARSLCSRRRVAERRQTLIETHHLARRAAKMAGRTGSELSLARTTELTKASLLNGNNNGEALTTTGELVSLLEDGQPEGRPLADSL